MSFARANPLPSDEHLLTINTVELYVVDKRKSTPNNHNIKIFQKA
jgi:hypothetical protein